VIVVTALGAVTALLAALVVLMLRTPKPSELQRRRETMRALRRVHGLLAADASVDEVAEALTETLGLRGCWFESGAVAHDLPEIDGEGDVAARVQHRVGGGLALPPLVALPVRTNGEIVGRFVLESDPSVGVSPERRMAALVMADVAGVAAVKPAAAPPGAPAASPGRRR
jgi:hypothetical protein